MIRFADFLGGPVLGLAGGAIVGRLAARKMDLGVDKGTVQSVSDSLDAGYTALFIYGTAPHAGTIVEAFKHFRGQIMATTVDRIGRFMYSLLNQFTKSASHL